MNLVDGALWALEDCDEVLAALPDRVTRTVAAGSLSPDVVMEACGRLMDTLDAAAYIEVMAALGIPRARGGAYWEEARRVFSREALAARLARELGVDGAGRTASGDRVLPLGCLLHIAAGNMDGLPAFSVLEGLLAGNVNILKLPAAEGGLSVTLLRELIAAEPRLAPYIYVFEYASSDVAHVRQLIGAADGVVVWGGGEAVAALRRLTPPNVRLIEWGHKCSFAYVTPEADDGALRGIAENIAQTGQLLCSACQGLFVDTADMAELEAVAERFLPLLDEALADSAFPPAARAGAGLKLYAAELEGVFTGDRLLRGARGSLRLCADAVLEEGAGFGGAWVRKLPREHIVAALRPYKSYLQTVGLACGAAEREELAARLLAAGAVRICSGARMSAVDPDAAHDGEYPLRRYTRIVRCEVGQESEGQESEGQKRES